MGCCSSRPVDSGAPDDHAAQPQVRHSPQAITSQTAINPTVRQPQPLEPPSTTSLHHSETSHSGVSTPQRSRSQQVGLAEHYNLPLQLPKPWTSKDRTWTKGELQRERYDFFETRVTGRREIWDALRQVSESIRERDIPTAQGILDAVSVTLPTGRLEEGGYDENGNLYRIHNAVLSDPTNVREGDGDEATVVGVAESKEAKVIDEPTADTKREPTSDEKGKAVVDKDALKIRCRLSDRGGPDVTVTLSRSQNVGTLAQRVRDEAQLPSTANVRIAYLGHILDEKQTLSEQAWKEGHVVNALITGVYS